MQVFWLDADAVRRELAQAVTDLASRHPEIAEVWLFGSLARGEARPGSDADLLIILSHSAVPFLDRALHYQPDHIGLGVDVLAYTAAEMAAMASQGSPFLKKIESEKVLLFQKP